MNGEQRLAALRDLAGRIRDREFPYVEREAALRDWAAYDEAQTRETDTVLLLVRDLVDFSSARVGARVHGAPKEGRPPVPASDLVKVLLAQSYFGRANRPAQGVGALFREKLRLTRPILYKTIERGFDRVDVDRVLDEVFLLTNEPVRGLETVFSGDGSGAPRRVGAHYARDRSGDRARRGDAFSGPAGDYAYHFMVIGVKYKVMAGWSGTARVRPGRGEHSLVPKALEDLGRTGHDVDQFL